MDLPFWMEDDDDDILALIQLLNVPKMDNTDEKYNDIFDEYGNITAFAQSDKKIQSNNIQKETNVNQRVEIPNAYIRKRHVGQNKSNRDKLTRPPETTNESVETTGPNTESVETSEITEIDQTT